MEPGRTKGVDGFVFVPLGHGAAPGLARAAGRFEPANRTAGSGAAAASRATTRSTVVDDAPGSGTGDRHSFCCDHRGTGTLSNQQAVGSLSRTGADRKIQW